MLPALIVGGLTAWYLGVRAGVLVAVAVAIALLIAMVVPGMSLAIYALVVAWSAALYFFGPKISKATGQSSMLGGTLGQAKSWANKLMGKRR